MTGDIDNEYLNTNGEESIYTGAGPDFELARMMAKGDLLESIKVL